MPVVNVDGVTESDGEVFKLMPAGIYPGRIESAEWSDIENSESKYAGATMLKYSVKATDPETELAVTVTDFIILPCEAMDAEQVRKARAKIKKLQIATGTEDMGNAIDNERFMYADVQVDIGVQKERTDKNTGTTYPERNSIRDILPM